MVSFGDIEEAFFFVSSAGYGMHTAVLIKDTGEILLRSEIAGLDEIDDDELEPGSWIAIPHRNDLDLGQTLVFDFVGEYLPDEYDAVAHIFRRRGAYGRFKDLLASKGLLETWYSFESERQEAALREWCADHDIELSD